jgi:hypothetical protein
MQTINPTWRPTSLQLEASKSLSRRTAHASSTLGRIRHFHASTLLYSSMVAVAIVADSQLKLRHREQLEESIEHEKAEILRLEHNANARSNRLLQAKHRKEDQIDYLETLTHYRPPRIPKRSPPQIPYITPQERPVSRSPQSPWCTAPLTHDPPSWTPKKLQTTSLCVARLVIRLCLKFGLYDHHLPGEPTTPFATYFTKSEAKLRRDWAKIEETLMDYQFCSYDQILKPDVDLKYPQYENQYDHLVDGLNHDMPVIFPRGADIEITKHMIVQVCELLLESKSHPDIFTINYLLNAFNRANRHDLIDMLGDLFNDAHFRANELTCCEFLRSYRRRGMSDKFLEFMDRLRAKRGPWIEAGPKYHEPKGDQRNWWATTLYNAIRPTIRPGVLFQAVNPHPIIYAEMLHGLLEFTGLHKTLAVCHELWQDNWGWSYACIHILIRQCIISEEWEIGITIWDFTKHLTNEGYPIPKELYARMLALCLATRQQKAFAKLLSESLINPFIPVGEMMGLVRKEAKAQGLVDNYEAMRNGNWLATIL